MNGSAYMINVYILNLSFTIILQRKALCGRTSMGKRDPLIKNCLSTNMMTTVIGIYQNVVQGLLHLNLHPRTYF